LTKYDGAYVALAEALAAPLLTCDGKLAGAHDHRATIELVAN
jgi:predicted nucleic acid-binding protein